MFQYRKRYEVTCDKVAKKGWKRVIRFNTASGMRSHVTFRDAWYMAFLFSFQYRKRYEVTCDSVALVAIVRIVMRFNTASGMRSHVSP